MTRSIGNSCWRSTCKKVDWRFVYKIYEWADQLQIFVKDLYMGWINQSINRSKNNCSNVALVIYRSIKLPRRGSKADQSNRRARCGSTLHRIFGWITIEILWLFSFAGWYAPIESQICLFYILITFSLIWCYSNIFANIV